MLSTIAVDVLSCHIRGSGVAHVCVNGVAALVASQKPAVCTGCVTSRLSCLVYSAMSQSLSLDAGHTATHRVHVGGAKGLF